MENHNATLANNAARPVKTVSQCQFDALKLHGMIYVIDHLLTECGPGELADHAATLITLARDLSRDLTDDLERAVA